MNIRVNPIMTAALLLATTCRAQTVTGSGTAGTVPVFTGSGTTSTIGTPNSPITVTSTGTVGIGTTQPAASIDIFRMSTTTNPSTSSGLAIGDNTNYGSSSDTAINGQLMFRGSGWAHGYFSYYPHKSDDLSYFRIAGQGTNYGDRNVGLLVSGRLGVGTTSPSSAIDVSGDIYADGETGAGQFPFFASLYGGTTSDGLYFTDYGVRHAGIKWNGTSLDFLNASNFGPNTDTWTAYTPQLSLNFASGNIGIGIANPQAKLEINGGLRFSGDPSGTVQTTAWTGVLCGGDYAEAMNPVGGKKLYEPGDVLVLAADGKGAIAKSSEPYSSLVAGIYATKPGVIGRRATLIKDGDEVPMAMIGVVPTKVTAENGPIKLGDLLVTSSLPGYAMKGTDRTKMLGAVIGKAMGSLESGTGVVEVLVTLQ